MQNLKIINLVNGFIEPTLSIIMKGEIFIVISYMWREME